MRRPLLAVAFFTCLASTAHAEVTRQQCAQSYEKAQYLRKEAKLRDARASLLVCANEACPAATRTDCVPWLAEVESAIPSVAVAVRDESGNDVAGAHVTIDGANVAMESGKAIDIDPGQHTVHVQTPDGLVADESFVARPSEKNRVVTLVVKSHAQTSAQPVTPETPPPAEPEHRSIALPLGLTVLGAAGLGAAFAFGFAAKSQASDLRSSCAPRCTDSDLDPVHSKLLFSDIGLGVGVVALIAATYFWLRPSEKPVAVNVQGASGGSIAIGF
ncbi:MAG TPA: hypothetical protein VIF62_06310 [Labilithrix sp.]